MNTFYIATEVDSMPKYPGGEYEAYQFISSNFRVNQSIIRESGTINQLIVASLLIDTLGNISDIKYPQSTGPLIELEMTRIFKIMPKWIPAYKEGNIIAARIYIPIRYIIKDHEFFINTSGNEMVVGHTKKTNALKVSLIAVTVTLFVFFFAGKLRFFGN